jgi:hypothetical protein
MPYIFVKSTARKKGVGKPRKKAAAKKRTGTGSGLKKFQAAVKKATASETRRIKAAEKLIIQLKKQKATKVKAVSKKLKAKR